tara:strand:- start:277 stop:579 length:303 start_codon:yes stop_codon:yes gene_type:complete
MFTKFINLPVFIVSFIIGIVFIRLSTTETKTVFVYPTPENVEHIEYVDRANNCFTYNYKKVECPTDKSATINIPPQMGRSKPQHVKAHQLHIGDTSVNKI